MSSKNVRRRKRLMRDLESVAAAAAAAADPIDPSVMEAFVGSLAELGAMPSAQLREVCNNALVPAGFTFLRMFDVGALTPFAMFASSDGRRLQLLDAAISVRLGLKDTDRVWLSTNVLPSQKPGVLDLEIVSQRRCEYPDGGGLSDAMLRLPAPS